MKALKCIVLAACSLVVGCTTAMEGSQVQLTENPEALAAYRRGQQAGMQGRHEEALQQFEAAIRYDPNFAEGHRLAGFALMSLGRAEEAIAHYEEATRLAPRLAVAWINLAAALGHMGRPEAGLEAYRRAAELDPGLAQRDAHISRALRQQRETFLPIEAPPRPYELDGFAVTPPTGENWRVRRGATRTKVIFERFTGRGGGHTVVAWAESVKRPHTEDLPEEVLRQTMEQDSQPFKVPPRFADLRFEATDTRKYGLSCRQLSFTVQDRGVPYAPGETFIMRGWELYCLHPESPTPVVLKLAHSQRYLPRWQPLPLETELETFREGVRVRPLSP